MYYQNGQRTLSEFKSAEYGPPALNRHQNLLSKLSKQEYFTIKTFKTGLV